jgi:hypothetical protein
MPEFNLDNNHMLKSEAQHFLFYKNTFSDLFQIYIKETNYVFKFQEITFEKS